MKTTKESVQRQSAKNNTAPTPQYTATMTPPNYGVSVADAPFIQAKLMVGSPHDPLEQEADRAADRFVNNLQSVGNAKPTVANTPIVQMKAAQTSFGGVAASPQVAQQIEAARRGGSPLPSTLRAPLESSFGTDFSQVRLHTDSQGRCVESIFAGAGFYDRQGYFLSAR